MLFGHSYGGTSLLFTDQTLTDKFVFWDASYITSKDSDNKYMKYNKDLDAYVLDWGLEIIVGKKFVDELKSFPDCGQLIKQIYKPVLFITTGKGNSTLGKKYFAKANNPKKLVHIKTADHNFNNWDDETTLFKETYNWLK